MIKVTQKKYVERIFRCRGCVFVLIVYHEKRITELTFDERGVLCELFHKKIRNIYKVIILTAYIDFPHNQLITKNIDF